MKKSGTLKKGKFAVIVMAAFIAIFCLAMAITNMFIPVRYLSAYMVFGENRTEGELRLTFLDVGFGDCILAELPDGKIMLIDGGNGDYSNSLALLSLLNSRGINKIDYLVCTSVKDEHCGGLAEVLRYKQVVRAYIPSCNNDRITEEYGEFISLLREKQIPFEIAEVGEGVAADDYFFGFISPVNSLSEEGEYALMNESATEENIERASAVMWLEYGENAFLFTSDARRETLERIVREYELSVQLSQPFCPVDGRAVELEKCDFVTVPAHGGKYNTYAPFFELISPKDAVVSVGENYSGCPDASALSNVCAFTQPYYTMYDGTITITADERGYTIDKEIK